MRKAQDFGGNVSAIIVANALSKFWVGVASEVRPVRWGRGRLIMVGSDI